MEEDDKELPWMKGAFDGYYREFVSGIITYKEFCEAIQHLPDVPENVKENHWRSLAVCTQEDIEDVLPNVRLIKHEREK